ncbi:glycerophosphodiester phosphodiesterase [Peribacillus alkalitolerans]|uniref:glycerophosphodiester phosphodiesterase n=1 Tax=Peribacillus alkalitolerans TaxID=1550385 RepID=UPI0013D6BD81|nr:glycerophosphodiester phosphodiesterase [Peribacillus alkalitolerans]
MGKTLIFAHRGSKGTHPENTLAAMQEAVRLGADGIELDVHLTKDGELVVIHDETVDRTTNGTGKVMDFTLEELKKLDAGSWFSNEFQGETIPTLKEVLQLLQGTEILLNVELKTDVIQYQEIEEKVLKDLEQFSYKDKAIISSFNHYSVQRIKQLDPEINIAILFVEILVEPWKYAASIGASALHVHTPVAYTEMSREAERNNFPLRVWTVNEEEDMKKLIGMNIDTIMTDFPEKALKIRDKE